MTMTKEAALIFFIALALAGAGYLIRPVDMRPITVGSSTDAGVENGGATVAISLEDARRHFEEGTALFADARSQQAYQAGHIAGAVNLDPGEFDAWSGDFFTKIPPDHIIITYCQGERCSLSLDLADKLTWMGYERVFFLKDGWGQWNESQLPVAPGTD